MTCFSSPMIFLIISSWARSARTDLILIGAHRLETQRRLLVEELRPDVGGHDDDRVAEVDRAALGIRQSAIFQDLQEDIEDLG